MSSNKEWLGSLKVGDKVAYDSGGWYGKNYAIDRIAKITPTGRIKTELSREFNSNGEVRGDGHYCLQPATKEIVEFINRKRLVLKLRGVKFENLSFDKLQAINNIIDGGENEAAKE